MGALPRARVYHQGIHETSHRNREQVAFGGRPTLLQTKGTGGFYQQKDA